MKKSIIFLLLFLVIISGHSQNPRYNYSGRFTPSIKKENLNYAKFLSEITPEFRRHFVVPYNEQVLVNQIMDQQSALVLDLGELTDYSQEFYSNFMDYVSIEILAPATVKP